MRQFCLVLFVVLLVLPASASAVPVASPKNSIEHVHYSGVKHIRYRYGPITIHPGQNYIRFYDTKLRPKVPGFITRFEPNLVRASTNKPPPVDLLHLHHVVWLVDGKPSFAAGEEKTIMQYPRGFGFKVSGSEEWAVTDMLHNLIAAPEKVYLTWDIDFVPHSKGRRIKPVSTQWMDVAGTKAYPVFDALRGWGSDGKYTFPDQAEGEERDKIGKAQTWEVPRDLTLVGGAGHLHPGGLYVDLSVSRGDQKVRLFRSGAKYFEPAGPVSWDVALGATSPKWRVKLRKGDLVSVSAAYDTSVSSWREAMGIFPIAVYQGTDAGGADPFISPPPQKQILTHGHLPENNRHGGKPTQVADPRSLPDGPRVEGPIKIEGFEYQYGDMDSKAPESYPPVVAPGQRIEFLNLDATRDISPAKSAYHTITSCKAPCTASTGIAYPLEDGEFIFDSGQLGFGPSFATPAANRDNWSTPDDLPEGTYTYFCRVHPFMRGSFRVKS